jgi:hypothetical protein
MPRCALPEYSLMMVAENGIVSADADAEDEAEADELPDVWREGAGDGASSEDEYFDAVDAFAAKHVGDADKEQGTDGGG